MKKALLLMISFLVFTASVSQALAEWTVNINAFSNTITNPLALELPAGTYLVTPIDQTQGGAYTAWNANGGGYGWWLATYGLRSAETGDAYYNPGRFGTAQEAFSYAVPMTFTLTTQAPVYFYIGDSIYGDNSGGVSLLVTVKAPPGAPIAQAGPDQSLFVGGTATLDGSGSSSPTGNLPLSYRWQIVSKPMGSSAALSSSTVANPLFTPDLAGEYKINLVVTDSSGLAGPADQVVVQAVTQAPVGWWKGEGNANDEIGGHHGTVTGGVSYAPGTIGQAFSFNGADGNILMGDPVPPSLQIQNEITLEAWIHIKEYPGPYWPTYGLGLIVGSQFDTGVAGATIFIDGRTNPDGQPSPPGHIHFQIGDGSWHTSNANAQVPLNQWVHVAATRKANESARIYYNGVPQPVTSVPWSGSISYAGAWFASGQQKDLYRPFNGLIDEVKIYNRALSAEEVMAEYQAGLDSTPPVISTRITGTVGSNAWYTGDVTVTWSVSDNESAITSQTGCEEIGISNDTAGTTLTCTATSAGGTSTESVTVKRDTTNPTATCGTADGIWHAADVSIPCSSADTPSGLTNPGDTTFTLATTVPLGTETVNALTGTHTVSDLAGHQTTAGPIGGNKIDKKAPGIIITTPANAEYLLNQPVPASFSCADEGSGVATCSGSVGNGTLLDTYSAGAKSFTVNATDAVGNASTKAIPYQVSYKFSGFLQPVDNAPTINEGKAGRTYSIKWQLRDYSNALVSSLGAIRSVNYEKTSCTGFTGAPTAVLESYVTGMTSLKFDSEANQYLYKWQAPGVGCYRLLLTLDSGQTFPAYFNFK